MIYEQLKPGDVIQEGDEFAYYNCEGLGFGSLDWETVQPWRIGRAVEAHEAIRRSVPSQVLRLQSELEQANHEITKLRNEAHIKDTALRLAIHVLVKGVEPRMLDQWPVLRCMVPDAIRTLRESLSPTDTENSRAPITRPAESSEFRL